MSWIFNSYKIPASHFLKDENTGLRSHRAIYSITRFPVMVCVTLGILFLKIRGRAPFWKGAEILEPQCVDSNPDYIIWYKLFHLSMPLFFSTVNINDTSSVRCFLTHFPCKKKKCSPLASQYSWCKWEMW